MEEAQKVKKPTPNNIIDIDALDDDSSRQDPDLEITVSIAAPSPNSLQNPKCNVGIGAAAILKSALYVASQTMFGAIGAAALKSAGHAGYNAKDGAEIGATGAAIMFIPSFLISCCIPQTNLSPLAQVVYCVATASLCGVVGGAVLGATMTAAQGAAASAVGSSIFGAVAVIAASCCGTSKRR